jgi:hypothetical protein
MSRGLNWGRVKKGPCKNVWLDSKMPRLNNIFTPFI